MSEIGQYILGQINPTYTTEPIDYTTAYENDWANRKSGTVMPPSPGVDEYTIWYSLEQDILYYKLTVKWRPATLWLAKQLPEWQIVNRSRTAVISASPLRVYENRKRLNSAIGWSDKLKQQSMTERESHEIFQIKMDTTLKYLEFDEEYIAHYIREHSTSSIGEGYRWGQMTSLSTEEWSTFFESTKRNIELLSQNEGRYYDKIWRTGVRARSPGMEHFGNTFKGEIDRSRVITFDVIRSSPNVFIKNKKSWYGEILSKTEDVLDVKPKVYYPYVEGGRIYTIASDLFKDGYTFYARDGKSWDASAGIILGPSFRPELIYMRGISIIGTGAFDTSLDVTIANLANSRNMIGEIIMLGDDNNQFVNGSTGFKDVPWVEEQAADTKYKYILGVSFADADKPTLMGLKAMSDRADKSKPVNYRVPEDQFTEPGKHSPQEIDTWIGMYLGLFGDDTLINKLKKEPLEDMDYLAPSKIMEDIVKKSTGSHSLAIAEREGIKKLVMA